MAYYHHPPHSTTSALSHGAMYSDVQNKPVPGQYFQSPPNPLQHDSPYTQSGTQSLAALQQQQQQQQQHQQQYPGGKARSPAFNGIPEASRGGLTRAGQLQQVPLGPPGPPGQPQQHRNNQSISAISQPPPSPANPQDLHTFPLQSPGFPQTQQPMASMAVPAAPNPPTQFPIQQYAQSSIAGQQPQSQQSFSNSGPQSQSKTPTNTTPTTQGHSQNPLGGGTGQPPRQILRPPLSPAAAKLETQRISALLDINRALIQEIVLLQAVGKAGVPGQTQGQSSAQVPGGGGSGGSPTGSIAGEGNTEKDGEKLPQQIGSREYVECMRRFQTNLAYLAAQADRPHKPSKEIPAYPAIMDPPPPGIPGNSISDESMKGLRDAYDGLKRLYPERKGRVSLATAAGATATAGVGAGVSGTGGGGGGGGPHANSGTGASIAGTG